MDDAAAPTRGSAPVDERALLDSLAKADSSAFSDFYDLYLPRVLAWVSARSGDPDKGEALTEEILTRAVTDLAVGPDADPLAIQVLRVARRVVAAR